MTTPLDETRTARPDPGTLDAPASHRSATPSAADEDKSAKNGTPPEWALMSKFEIPNFDEEGNYLTRWRVIQTPWFGLYLHRIDTPDSRPTLHDHPWDFTALVLRGGYIERRLNTRTMTVDEDRKIRWVNRMRTHDYHAITRLRRVPTWTLVVVGKRRRTWGYLEPDVLGVRGEWVWTEFDKHPHNEEFMAAMTRRRRTGADDPVASESGNPIAEDNQ